MEKQLVEKVQEQGGVCNDIQTTQVNIRQLQGKLNTNFTINPYIWQHFQLVSV